MNELLYNLLQRSKSQMNLLQFKLDKLNVKLIMDKAVRLVQFPARTKRVNIVADIDETLIGHGDKEMVEFIIRNLLSNAIKFYAQMRPPG